MVYIFKILPSNGLHIQYLVGIIYSRFCCSRFCYSAICIFNILSELLIQDYAVQDFAVQRFAYLIFCRNNLFKILLFLQIFVQDIDDKCFKVQDFAMHPIILTHALRAVFLRPRVCTCYYNFCINVKKSEFEDYANILCKRILL